MIRSWKNATSQSLWSRQSGRSRGGFDADAAIDLLLALNVARHKNDLMPLHAVGLHRKKKRKKRYVMAADDRWHVRFDWRKGAAYNVLIVGEATDKSSATSKHQTTENAESLTPAVHPGRLLRRELVARQLSANRLSLDIGVPSGRITDILNARRAITADTAVRFARYLGVSAQFWLDLQSQFDIAVVERRKGAEIRRRVKRAASKA